VHHIETSVYPVTVQFEDVDASGIVHHPNYLRYCERARCDAMAARGYTFGQCLADGTAFVVAESLLRYLRPAVFGDKLWVVSAYAASRKSSLKVHQVVVKAPPPGTSLATPGEIFRLPEAVFHGQIRLVHVESATGRPVAMTDIVRRTFGLGSAMAAPSADADPCASDVRLSTAWDDIL
jgi:YbgC/YbaW family acyl-CoA thioester hydrolase